MGKSLERKDGSPGVGDAKCVGRKLDWVPAVTESAALARMGEAEVEKRALVRFTLFTALRERRVTPREVSIVLDSDNDGQYALARGFIWKEHADVVFNIQTQI
jgi:hypothetical protein